MARRTTDSLLRSCANRAIGLAAGRLRGPARVLARLWPNVEVSLRVRGQRMSARSLDRIAAMFLWKFGLLERAEELAMRREVSAGMTALDIGANIGVHTLLLARLVGPVGRVYAFEPDRENYAQLEKNVRANACSNVRCERAAVSDRDGEIPLYFCEEHRGDHRTFDSGDGRTAVLVSSIRLDTFLGESAKIDFIKMDVQGAELLALEGMRKTIERNPRVKVLCEFSPSLLRLCGSSPEEYLRLWKSLGFKFYAINEDGSASPIPDSEMRSAEFHGVETANFLLKRE